jgi:hypothetical protein
MEIVKMGNPKNLDSNNAYDRDGSGTALGATQFLTQVTNMDAIS